MITQARRLIACFLAVFSLAAPANEHPPLSHQVAGGDSGYVVQPGDFLIAIGARFGLPSTLLARDNALPYATLIHPGQSLRIHNPHIVPAGFDDGILINLPQRMLFHFSQGTLRAAYPVGLGKPDWPTPEGEFRIVAREANKVWKVPLSIQEEMRRENRVVREEVPAGPDNPLGAHWLGLDLWGYGIHGTIASSSVYRFRSHGCIRLHPDDIAELFDRVTLGTAGRIIYQPVLMAVVEDGRILLEVHRDIYEKRIDPAQTVRKLAEAHDLNPAIDWSKVEAVIAAQDGLAREVGRLARNNPQGNP
jgi:L,D-transpeptidase ErfK/SrfK